MNRSREEILSRIRTACPPSARSPIGLVERTYLGPSGAGDLHRFVDRVIDYRANLTRCGPAEIPTAVAAALDDAGAARVVLPAGVDPGWVPRGFDVVDDYPPLTARQMDTVDAALTTCALAIAETGTIVLDHGPGQGRRALTLVPDLHVVVVSEDLVVAGVPDAIARLDPTRPQTWISGPSATSDIELNRIEGVHGPRSLHVIICAAQR